jgi:hypothetical protein
MATNPKPPALVQLLATLQKEKIEFMLVGMSAANLQGVLATTIDVDIWIGLPSRQYMRVINLCQRLAATLRSPNKVYLLDGTPVDFIYEISGLRSFASELRNAKRLPFHGLTVPVLPLARICRSKQAAARDKDKLHVVLIRQTICAQRAGHRKKRPPARRGETRQAKGVLSRATRP